MRQPQFIMLTGETAQWININEISRAMVKGDLITLILKNGEHVPLHSTQDVQYVQTMLNRLSEIPKERD
jgi:hypothetical protein